MELSKHFKQAVYILEVLENNGYEAYFVGGAVRDLFLERKNSDIDIATSATPFEVKELFSHTIDTGLKHGTVMVQHAEQFYDVTTFRTDGKYLDCRRPQSVTFVRTLQEDLARRDFTINALAMDRHGRCHDYFFGLEDLKGRVICAVGDPVKRFSEDALRILRVVRFQSQLNFSIEKTTLLALEKCAPNLQLIAQERISTEFMHLLQGEAVNRAIVTLTSLKIINYLPQLENLQMITFKTKLSLEEKWCILILHEKLEPKLCLQKWKCSRNFINNVNQLVTAVRVFEADRGSSLLLFNLGLNKVKSVQKILNERKQKIKLSNILTMYEQLPIHKYTELAVTATDIIAWTPLKKHGKWISDGLEAVLKAVLDREIENNKELIKKWWQKRNCRS